jgi:putative glycosyl hydrolase
MSVIRHVLVGLLVALLLVSIALLSRTCGSLIAATDPDRSLAVEDQVAVPETFFGMHIHRAVPTARFPAPCAWPDVGFYGWRLWDASVSWPALEASPNQWTFATLDSSVALAEQEGAEILLPLGLTPAWASSRPDEPSAYGPGNAAPPLNLDDWRTYVRTVATRYRGRITHYEIWNEPNLTPFFSGSVQDMLALASEAYRILKEVDPENVVVSPSATSGEAGLRWLEGYLGRGGRDVCDIVGFHFYTGGQPPETIRRLALLARRVLDRTGAGSKPLWNTETGWSIPSQFPSDGATPNAQQQTIAASYLSRALVSAWAGGVKRFYWYSWDNLKMGLTEADGKTEKPAALAYRVTRRWLLSMRVKDWSLGSTNVYSVTLERPDGRLNWMVWTSAGNGTFRVPPDWKVMRVEDLTGTAHPPSDFVVGDDVQVGPSPILLEGAPQ